MTQAKTILIIGGTSGLGKKLCELYCLDGYNVGVIGRRKHLLEELSAKFPNNVHCFQLDISSSSCFQDINRIIGKLNGIDKLILTASLVEFNPDLSLDLEKKTLKTNVIGYASVLNTAYRYFLNKTDGQIVVVTSTAAARGNKTAPAYNASKAFQSSYIEGLRLKLSLENRNIKVTELIPGYMDTEMAKGERLFWITDLSKAGSQAKRAIDKGLERCFISKRWALVYYIYKFIPSFLYRRVINSQIKFQTRHN